MSERSSKLQRAVNFFREAPLDEARATYTIVQEVMTERLAKVQKSTASQNKAASTPRKRRRTKAEIAAAKMAPAASQDQPSQTTIQGEAGTVHIS